MLREDKVLALGGGAIAALGFQPLGLWPLTLVALYLFMHLAAAAPTARRVALLGWLFGLGHFTIGNNWIATAFTYQAEMPAWLGWIAVVALALYLAVYPLLAALAAWLLRKGTGAAGRIDLPFVLLFAGCWTISEWLRSWVFTGYVWNPLGMVTLGGFGRPGLASLSPWLGTYALSALVIVFAGVWGLALSRWGPKLVRGSLAKAIAGLAALVALPAAVWFVGLGVGQNPDRGGTLAFTLVQPNVPQEELTEPQFYEGQFRRTAALSRARSPGQRRLVLWPESGVPDYLRPGYPQIFYDATTYAGDPDIARARIGKTVGKGGMLLTGAVDLEMDKGRVVAARNSITALDSSGTIRGSYDKAHLVPYGEYLPMRGLLEPLGLTRLVAGSLDFWAGPGAQTVDLGPWGKAGMQICYEIIFSGQVVDRHNRPDYIYNPSNDGWFGSFGPPQHLAQARMRAIEEGLPVLRATTTGISAVIDADGVVRHFLPQHVAGRIDGHVPPAHPPTWFALLGNWLALGWAVLLLIAGTLAGLRRRAR